jgi:hypothetical protein
MSQAQTEARTIRGTIVVVTVLSLLTAFAGSAVAHEQSNLSASKPAPQTRSAGAADLLAYNAPAPRSAFDRDTLPSLDLIDAQTDIKVFLQSWVPEELRVAALRSAWTRDPAIRDFIGLQEMDWDFSDLNSILGFGELEPEVDSEKMVAQIFGEASPVVARGPERQPTLFSRVVLRLLDLASTAAVAK